MVRTVRGASGRDMYVGAVIGMGSQREPVISIGALSSTDWAASSSSEASQTAIATVSSSTSPADVEIRVKRVTAFYDIGRLINPVLAKGQIEGGLTQALGYAVMEKMDINEEKVRLDSHILYFKEILEVGNIEKGKKLGFIAQEIGREINTIGSKSNDANMQKLVVQMKDELEKIKEQVLNVV